MTRVYSDEPVVADWIAQAELDRYTAKAAAADGVVRLETVSGRPVFVMYAAGVAVGFLSVERSNPLEWFSICTIYVVEQHRRRGIATALHAVAISKFGTFRKSAIVTADGRKWLDSLKGIRA